MAQASAEKLEYTGPAEKEKSGLSATERAVGNAGAALAERKRAVCPEYQIMRGERVKMGESRTLAGERGITARAWSGKGGLHGEQGRFQGGQGGQARAVQDDLQSLGFTPSLAKPEIAKEVGMRRARS